MLQVTDDVRWTRLSEVSSTDSARTVIPVPLANNRDFNVHPVRKQ